MAIFTKLNNIFKKNLMIIIFFIIVILGYIAYNYFYTIEKFTWDQPTYKGDPFVLNQEIYSVRSQYSFQNISSNSSTLYLLSSQNEIFMYRVINNLFNLTNYYLIKINNPIPTNSVPTNSTVNQISCENGDLPLLAANEKIILYYDPFTNNSRKISCLYYLPIVNINDNTTSWTCLQLPSVSDNLQDKIRLLTISNNFIFAIGCNNTGTLYYCSLDNNGLPQIVNNNYWNTLQIPNLPEINSIKLLKANSNYLFYVDSNNSKIIQLTSLTSINTDNTLNVTWVELFTLSSDANLLIDDLAINNDVIWLFDISTGTKLWWCSLTDGQPDLNKSWNSMTTLVGSIIDMVISKNTLFFLSSNLLKMDLYDPSITINNLSSETTTTNVTTTTIPTTTIDSSTTTTGNITTSGTTTTSNNITTTTVGSRNVTTSGNITSTTQSQPSTTSRGDFLLGISDSNPSDNNQSTASITSNELSSMLPSNFSINDVLNGLSNNMITPQSDFLANNNMFGNNLYISPMNNFPGPTGNQSSLVAGLNINPDQIQVQNGNTKRKISSMFFPMVKMI